MISIFVISIRGSLVTCALLTLLALSIGAFMIVGDSAELIKIEEATSVLATGIAGKVIIIDPGHGGRDPGVTVSGVQEKDIVLSISHYLRKLLIQSGAIVIMTRIEDRDLSASDPTAGLRLFKESDLKNRAAIANSAGGDAFISIHANGVHSPRWYGAQMFYNPEKGEGDLGLAEAIQARFTALTNTYRLPNCRERLYLLQNVEIPSVIVEVGFLSNPSERLLLMDSAYQRKVAWAVFWGLVDWFSLIHER